MPKTGTNRFELPCGCRLCGCCCREHSPRGIEEACDVHAFAALARWVAGDAAALLSLGLFLAVVVLGGAVLTPERAHHFSGKVSAFEHQKRGLPR